MSCQTWSSLVLLWRLMLKMPEYSSSRGAVSDLSHHDTVSRTAGFPDCTTFSLVMNKVFNFTWIVWIAVYMGLDASMKSCGPLIANALVTMRPLWPNWCKRAHLTHIPPLHAFDGKFWHVTMTESRDFILPFRTRANSLKHYKLSFPILVCYLARYCYVDAVISQTPAYSIFLSSGL